MKNFKIVFEVDQINVFLGTNVSDKNISQGLSIHEKD